MVHLKKKNLKKEKGDCLDKMISEEGTLIFFVSKIPQGLYSAFIGSFQSGLSVMYYNDIHNVTTHQ